MKPIVVTDVARAKKSAALLLGQLIVSCHLSPLAKAELHKAAQDVIADAAEQTASLREENARLRALAGRLVSIYYRDEGVSGKEIRRFVDDAEGLLADPEGQRAGEEWRALVTVENSVRAVIAAPGENHWPSVRAALAAVDRARQP